MRFPLPQGYEPHEFPADYSGPFWIKGQIEAYGQACRAAALEEAALVCSHKAETKRLFLNEAHYLECAEAIRRLI